ncbi:replication protein A 70 kDa DNA-binding subunit A-like [Bidens hawaiensis]|uniref:replication protein A 70 kDa DNA-binding subunit A-like n=1 Tax=Bidens hawaiensis TaxID=980011 RepID=UPI00404A3235
MESQKFTMLHEIDVLRSTPSTIKVKVLKVWSVKDNIKPNEDFLIEMVFMDESSTVFKQDIFRFKRYLNENATLTIVNPSLGSNASNYKVIDCPNKLVLNSSTHVNPCSQFDGPTFGFKFYSFKSVIDKEIPLKATIDIIGHVVHVFKDNNSNLRDAKRNARLTMEVSDISGDSVYVTLWGDYVSQFSKYVVDHFDESHMIILMQFGRVKYHKEKPYVSNSYGSDVTRVFLNDSISEIEDYKTCLFEFLEFNVDGVVRRPILVKLMSTLDEEFLMATSFFNICKICTILQPKSIIVLETIKAVCPNSEWYYVGCNSCSRKVIITVVEGEDVYECKNQRCNNLGVTPTPRFKIKLRVQDGSGVVSLTLFDRDAKLIINKTTSELLATKDEDDVGHSGFPTELNCLLEKKFAFKVEIADFNFRNNVEVYGISKLTDDQEIISAIEKRLMPDLLILDP